MNRLGSAPVILDISRGDTSLTIIGTIDAKMPVVNPWRSLTNMKRLKLGMRLRKQRKVAMALNKRMICLSDEQNTFWRGC